MPSQPFSPRDVVEDPPLMRQSIVGQAVPRLEDRPLVAGEGCFVADINFPHQLHMYVVRSYQAHGRILSIETEAAWDMPGVTAVWTGSDVADIPPIPFRATKVEGLEPYCQPILAQGTVRYVGEPVAVVFAEDAYLAEDAANRVLVQIEEAAPILTADAEPGEFQPGRSTEPTVIHKGYGDLEAGFREAAHIVELDLSIGRHSGVPLETRGAVARHDRARDVLELHGAAKRAHWNRDQLAVMLARSPASIQLYEYHVGGGFGVRGELYPEDVLILVAALRLRRPIKWIEDRREHLMATNHSREQRHVVRAGIDAAGRILAVENRFFHDQGAYVRTHGARVADMAAGLLLGPYLVPAYRAAGHFRLTNKTPAATYRAPSRFESTFVRERLMDAIAAELALDPIALRRVNLIDRDDMPYRRPLTALDTEVVLDSGDYAGLLDKALQAAAWQEMRAAMTERRQAGELVGAGLAFFVEKSGLGPYDGVRISVDTAGQIEVITGASSLGQGMETVVAQICADALGVDYRRIRVVHGQTDRIEFGYGAHASRVTVMTGEATRVAAVKLRDKALSVAAELLQEPAAALDIIDGNILRASGEIAMSLGDIARNLAPTAVVRGEREPGLSAEGWFNCEHMTYPYGTHIAQVRVDAATGGVTVERYYIAYDVGRAVNPKLVEGQIVGGLAQGLGGALLEEFLYNERGEPLCTTFADYLMPTAREMPPVDVLILEDAPSPLNPLGLKGAGEGGVTAAGAAIAAAIDDAIGIPGAIKHLPVTPHMIYELLQARGTPQASAASLEPAS